MSLRAWVSRRDPRLALLLAALAGLAAWRAAPVGLIAYNLLGWGGFALAAPGHEFRASVVRVLKFVALWSALLALADWLGGATPQRLMQETPVLAARLLAMLGVGLALVALIPRRELCLAVTSLLSPFLGERSWKPGLALALMVHYPPLLRRTFAGSLASAEYRLAGFPAWKRRLIGLAAGLRAMGQQTWRQTLAIAARNLDGPEAWAARLAFDWREWAAGALVGVALASPLWLDF